MCLLLFYYFQLSYVYFYSVPVNWRVRHSKSTEWNIPGLGNQRSTMKDSRQMTSLWGPSLGFAAMGTAETSLCTCQAALPKTQIKHTANVLLSMFCRVNLSLTCTLFLSLSTKLMHRTFFFLEEIATGKTSVAGIGSASVGAVQVAVQVPYSIINSMHSPFHHSSITFSLIQIRSS